jgi:ATP-dependent Clp protease ATP-binding subunit ClpB
MNDEFVSIEHLILAIFASKSKVAQILKDQGVTEKGLKAAIDELRKGERVTSASAEETYNALNKYAKNLNELAANGKLDPVIGRDEEIRRVLQILTRRTKNNPMLVGEPGVGKTAIAEGLAHRIVDGDVPETSRTRSSSRLIWVRSSLARNTKESLRTLKIGSQRSNDSPRAISCYS